MKYIFFFIKIVVAVVVCSILVRNDMLKFSYLIKFIQDYSLLSLFIILLFVSDIILTAYRWQLLLENITKKQFDFIYIQKISWIGMAFTTILPSIISADLIKFSYLKIKYKELKQKQVILSIIMDRIYGLMTIFILAGIASLLKESIFSYVNFTAALVAIVLSGFIYILSVKNKLSFSMFIKSIVITLYTQGINILIFFLIIQSFVDFPVIDAFIIYPITSLSADIPISPSGIGISHFAFNEVLAQFEVSSGASIFNIYLIFQLTVNVIGLLFFLKLNKPEVSE